MENRARLLSVDILKGLGIIAVVIIHPIVWMYVYNDQGGLRYAQGDVLLRFLCYSGAPFFALMLPVLAAISFFWAFAHDRLGLAKVLGRALAISALGFLMNFLAWGSRDAFDWDVLQFIALSMLVTYPLLKKLPRPAAVWTIGLLGVVALFFARSFPQIGSRHSYAYAVLFGDLSGENYWPLLPWFSLFALGICLGFSLLRWERVMPKLPVLGALLFFLAFFSGNFFPQYNPTDIWGPAIFKPPVLFMAGQVGFYLMVIPLTQLLLKKSIRLKRWLEHSALVVYAQGILWIYLTTVIVGFHLAEFIFSLRVINFKQSLLVVLLMVSLNLFLGYLVGRVVSLRKRISYV